MKPIWLATLRGIFRDRVFRGILVATSLFLLIPSVSTLSMRQVSALATTLSLSLVSFILLLLAVFLAGPILWRDMERRYTFGLLGLPVSRPAYLLGKFAGVGTFLLLVTLLLGTAAMVAVWFASGAYPPDRPISWSYLGLALGFDLLKYLLLVACTFLFASLSTSFFLPIFGSIAIFLAGSASQEVYDFIHSDSGQNLPELARQAGTALYYLLPNFGAFDLKVHAVYGVPLSMSGMGLTVGYWAVYTTVVLFLASVIFSRREMK